MSEKPLHISDHAVLRYLERAHGLDVAAVKKHLAGRAVNAIRLGAVGVQIEGVKLVIHNATMTTALKAGWPSRDDHHE